MSINNRWKSTEFQKSGGWDSPRVDMLKALSEEGYSIAQIAAKIGNGVTRSAVGKHAYRIGLRFRGGVREPVKAKPKRPVVTSAEARVRGAAGRHTLNGMKFAADASATVIPLIELERHQCHWPHGHPGEPGFGFCGQTVKSESPYCATHHARAYQVETKARVA